MGHATQLNTASRLVAALHGRRPRPGDQPLRARRFANDDRVMG
jgi:hypothetical protein